MNFILAGSISNSYFNVILLGLILSFIRAIQTILFSKIQTTKIQAFWVPYWVLIMTNEDSTSRLIGAEVSSSHFWAQKIMKLTILWSFFAWPYSLKETVEI